MHVQDGMHLVVVNCTQIRESNQGRARRRMLVHALKAGGAAMHVPRNMLTSIWNNICVWPARSGDGARGDAMGRLCVLARRLAAAGICAGILTTMLARVRGQALFDTDGPAFPAAGLRARSDLMSSYTGISTEMLFDGRSEAHASKMAQRLSKAGMFAAVDVTRAKRDNA
jgi:hypothetical protein